MALRALGGLFTRGGAAEIAKPQTIRNMSRVAGAAGEGLLTRLFKRIIPKENQAPINVPPEFTAGEGRVRVEVSEAELQRMLDADVQARLDAALKDSSKK